MDYRTIDENGKIKDIDWSALDKVLAYCKGNKEKINIEISKLFRDNEASINKIARFVASKVSVDIRDAVEKVSIDNYIYEGILYYLKKRVDKPLFTTLVYFATKKMQLKLKEENTKGIVGYHYLQDQRVAKIRKAIDFVHQHKPKPSNEEINKVFKQMYPDEKSITYSEFKDETLFIAWGDREVVDDSVRSTDSQGDDLMCSLIRMSAMLNKDLILVNIFLLRELKMPDVENLRKYNVAYPEELLELNKKLASKLATQVYI
jgi:hypothetical protein